MTYIRCQIKDAQMLKSNIRFQKLLLESTLHDQVCVFYEPCCKLLYREVKPPVRSKNYDIVKN